MREEMRPDRFDSWLTVDAKGLKCRPGGFHIDPSAGAKRAIVTHGHSDHARPGHQYVLATRETLAIMEQRLGQAASRGTQAIAYGEKITIGEVEVTLVPAGHVLGAPRW
jgi:putative mRNA 3-end processing factor